MLTGNEPFRGESRSELNDQIKYKRVNFSLLENDSMRELVKKMLERDVKMRVSANEALEMIRKIKKERDEMIMIEKKKDDIKENKNKKDMKICLYI